MNSTETITKMRDEGKTYSEITDYLNKTKTPTPGGRGKWYPSMIKENAAKAEAKTTKPKTKIRKTNKAQYAANASFDDLMPAMGEVLASGLSVRTKSVVVAAIASVIVS